MSYLKIIRLVPAGMRAVVRKLKGGIAPVLSMGAAFLASPAMAALPAAVQPAGGAGAGDYTKLLQSYWQQGIAVIVLMVAAYAFVEVGGGAIAKFGEWRNGKAELTELKWYFLIGVVMLVTVVYLLTTAAGIL